MIVLKRGGRRRPIESVVVVVVAVAVSIAAAPSVQYGLGLLRRIVDLPRVVQPVHDALYVR